MNDILQKEQFEKFVLSFFPNGRVNVDFLYEVYESVHLGLLDISKNKETGVSFEVNRMEILLYLMGEYIYSTQSLSDEDLEKFLKNESFKTSMANVIADKYISLSVYNHIEQKLTNKYYPPISSLELYVNLMHNIVNNYPLKDGTNMIIVDLLNKTLSIARCIIKLLCDGYETEAFAMWRTLHECECVLILLDKYKKEAIPAYVKHMQYSIIYRQPDEANPVNQQIFEKLKGEMHDIGLKSKDTKKYIEYGWILSIPGHENVENFKLNFRDGVETLAGLHQYSEVYMTSSEILHGSPMLIYSNKQYFHYLTLLNLYESFFRICTVFESLFFPQINEEARARYIDMKKLYFSQLINIHKRESYNFRLMNKKKQGYTLFSFIFFCITRLRNKIHQ